MQAEYSLRMPWSTRELAELAGTTVNTVRHYHRLGLLEVPERRFNGYKQYGVAELVCLLRIRRLAELGVPLSQIAERTAGGNLSPESLQTVDDELAGRIEQLQQARADIAAILQGSAPADAPRGFEAVASRLSDADSSMIHMYTKLYDQETLADLARMVENDDVAVEQEFNVLELDADEATRQRIAEGMAPALAKNMVEFPWLHDPAKRLPKGGPATAATFIEAVRELYNPTQLDVMRRANDLAQQLYERMTADASATPETDASPSASVDDDDVR